MSGLRKQNGLPVGPNDLIALAVLMVSACTVSATLSPQATLISDYCNRGPCGGTTWSNTGEGQPFKALIKPGAVLPRERGSFFSLKYS